MGNASFEILLIFVLIVANGVFAMAEAALVASRKARLQQAAQEGDGKAKAALALAENPNRFLSTVQIGITLIGILSGAFGGATLSKSLAEACKKVPSLAPYADSIGIGVVVVAITYFSLIVGELVPKRLALHAPERIAGAMALPMSILSLIASPFVTLLTFSSDLVLRLLGQRASDDPPVTEEEIKVMVAQGTEAGVFHAKEQDIIERVFRLGDRKARSLMTHRPDVLWIDIEDSPVENQRALVQSPYSRVLVCRGDLDHVVGIVRAKDLLAQCFEGGEPDLSAVLQPPVYVPESVAAFKVLEIMQTAHTHLVIVIDEHGGTQGLLTLQDIMSAIVGEMPNTEDEEAEATRREDGSWLVDGLIALEDFKSLFHLGHLPGEEDGEFQTLNGFILHELGRIPATGDHFEAAALRFEIMDMDGQRIDKVLISPSEGVGPAS